MGTCTVEGCDKSAFCRGWCSKHYTRWQRHGDPLVITRSSPMLFGATTRMCPRCMLEKPLDQYGVRPSGAPKGYCIPCQAEYDKGYATSEEGSGKRKAASLRHSASDQRRDKELRKRYGITLDQFREMLDKQGGVCAICKVDQPTPGDPRRRWNVDHCHATRRVRGLLCVNCNMGLGYFQDNPQFLARAIEYLAIQRA